MLIKYLFQIVIVNYHCLKNMNDVRYKHPTYEIHKGVISGVDGLLTTSPITNIELGHLPGINTKTK